MARLRLLFLLILVILSACASPQSTTAIPLIPETTPAEVRALLAASPHPVVLNVWASWCVPCRSEAPLLREAHGEHGNAVTFVGVAIRDSQDAARAFIAEFALDGFDHLFDPSAAVPADLGGFGVPITFFFAAGGHPVAVHNGVIDERTLVLLIDEALAASR